MNNGLKKALLVSSIIIGILGIIWYFNLYQYISLSSLQENKVYLKAAVDKNYIKSVLIFLAVYIGIIALLIPGVPPLTIIGGFLFGFWSGLVYSAIGAAAGATCSFLLIRYVLSNIIRGKYAQTLEKFNEKIKSQGAGYYLLTMQLLGIVPYFIINTLAALAHVSAFTFFWTTCVGSLPTLIVYTLAGQRLSTIQSFKDVYSAEMIVLVVVMAAVGLIPLLFKLSKRFNFE